MKHIKMITEFFGGDFSELGIKNESFPKRSFDKFTRPVEPFKRELTDEERRFMFKNFRNHSWSNVDATGKIVLGGGEDSAGKYYITEEDLEKFMNKK